MRKTTAILSIFSTCMVALAAHAQSPESAPPAGLASEAMPELAAAPAPQQGPRLVLGVDMAFQNPVSSSLRDSTDLGLGGLVRFEYVLRPRLNLTVRAGYIYSLQKGLTIDSNKVKNSVDNIPVWVGGKYFVFDNVYAGVEFGLNMLTISSETTKVNGSEVEKTTETSGEYKVGMNVGAGVLLKSVDIRAQLEVLDFGKASDSLAFLVTAGFNILPL